MRITTDIEEANNLLKEYIGATAQIWMFHISHQRLAIRLSYPKKYEVIYIVAVSSEYINGPFTWSNANIEVIKEINNEKSESNYKIRDKEAGFELDASGGFTLTKGQESEFGKSFEDFYLDKDKM